MIAILGAGYAGAATAWALARRGHGSRVTVIEAEPEPGRHASGRNAGLVTLLSDADEPMEEMAARGMAALAGMPHFSRTGSLHLTSREAEVDRAREKARRRGRPLEVARVAESAHPWLRGARATWAMAHPEDGTIEPRRLLDRYLDEARERGVRLLTGARAHALTFGCGRLNGIETSQGKVRADWVVDAAGAWAGELGTRLGSGEIVGLGLRPFRRHLVETGPLPGTDPSLPFVWDLDEDVYVRPSGGGLMACACDEEPHEPGEAAVDDGARAQVEAKLRAALPALARTRWERARACLRTFTPDRRYAIGPEGRLPGFFWIAGLGGSGALASAAVGELAADLLLTGGTGGMDWTREASRWFDPARLSADTDVAGRRPAEEKT